MAHGRIGGIARGTNSLPTIVVPQQGVLTLYPDDIVVWLGDSITSEAYEWWGPAVTAIDGFYGETNTFFEEGVGGNILNQMLARIADVTAHNPDVVVIEGGINDAALNVDVTVVAEKLTAIVAALRADNADVRLAVGGPLINGATIDQSATNLHIDAVNTAMAATAAGLDVPYIDWRAHYKFLYQTAPVTAAALVTDGVHPSTAGKAFMSEKFLLQTRLHHQ
jgi:lysophospholipase L1-like esterase